MTLDELLTDLNNRIGSTPEVSNANMTTWINEGLRAFCREHDFTWLEKKATASSVASQAEYDLPDDYRRAVELRVDGTTSSPNVYSWVPHEQRVLYDTSQRIFSEFGGSFALNPIPSAVGTNNIELWYLRRPTNMTVGTQSPSDAAIASMPAEYHEALVIYAFAIYNSYDEEHDEKRELMGNPRNPVPGTYYYYVNLAIKDDTRQKRGGRRKFMSFQEFVGHSHPNQTPRSNTVLGN